MLPDTLSKYIKVSEKSPKLFVQLYGKPVTGKTTGALTFPNPLVVNFDNNLPAGVKQIPMYDDAFVDGIVKRSNPRYPANRRDALKAVMIDLCREMPEGSTIIVDSMSRVESAYNMQEDIEPKELTNKGEVDGFKMFRKRLTFYEDLFVLAQAARAHVLKRCGYAADHHLRLARDGVRHAGARALVWNVDELRTGHRRKHFRHEMHIAAVAARCVIDRARMRFRERDQFLHVLRRQRGVDDEHMRRRGDHADRREVAQRVVRQLRHQRLLNGEVEARERERQSQDTTLREDTRRIAYHEAGHAVAQAILLRRQDIGRVSIVSTTEAQTFNELRPLIGQQTYSRQEVLAEIQVKLASRAAEELFLDLHDRLPKEMLFERELLICRL